MLFHLPQKEGNVFCFMKLAARSEGWVWQHRMTLCLICLCSRQICKCSVSTGKWTMENKTQCASSCRYCGAISHTHTHTHTHTHCNVRKNILSLIHLEKGNQCRVHRPGVMQYPDFIQVTLHLFISNKFSTCLK